MNLRGVVRTGLLLVVLHAAQVVVLTTRDGAGPLAQVWGRL